MDLEGSGRFLKSDCYCNVCGKDFTLYTPLYEDAPSFLDTIYCADHATEMVDDTIQLLEFQLASENGI